jgi:hypothetical protein
MTKITRKSSVSTISSPQSCTPISISPSFTSPSWVCPLKHSSSPCSSKGFTNQATLAAHLRKFHLVTATQLVLQDTLTAVSQLRSLGILLCPSCYCWVTSHRWNDETNSLGRSASGMHSVKGHSCRAINPLSVEIDLPTSDDDSKDCPTPVVNTVLLSHRSTAAHVASTIYTDTLTDPYITPSWARSTRDADEDVSLIVSGYLTTIKNLTSFLAESHLYPVWVNDSGSCLFHSTAFAINIGVPPCDQRWDSTNLRALCVSYMQQNWVGTDYDEACRAQHGCDLLTHSSRLANTNVWAGDMEAMALACALNITIKIHTSAVTHIINQDAADSGSKCYDICFDCKGHYYALCMNPAFATTHNNTAMLDFCKRSVCSTQLLLSLSTAAHFSPVQTTINQSFAVLNQGSSLAITEAPVGSSQNPIELSPVIDLTIESQGDVTQHSDAWQSLRDSAIDEQTPCLLLNQSHSPVISPLDIANHRHIERDVHFTNITAWMNLVKSACKKYLASTTHTSKLDALINIMSLPSCLVRGRAGKKKSDKSRERAIQRQHDLITSRATSGYTGPTTRSQTRAPQQQADARRGRRVDDLAAHGYLSKAADTWINREALADLSTPENIEILKQLHPTCSDSLPSPPAQIDSSVRLLQPDGDFVDLVKSFDNGSAPGPSGWTARLIMRTLYDETCLTGFCRLINDINTDNLPPEARQYILPCTLVAVPKKNGGLRPIAIGEIFYRIAAKFAKRTVEKDILDMWNGIQLGINVPGGCETAIHTIKACLLDDEPLAVISFDFKNAYNCTKRAAILKHVYSTPRLAPLWNLINFAYSQPSALYTRDADGKVQCLIQSEEGVRQGDPIASLLFASVVQPIYDLVAQSTDATPIAIHDDLSVAGKPDDLIKVVPIVKQLASKIGLELQPSKCQLAFFHPCGLTSAQKSGLAALNIPVHTEVATFLGCPIAANRMTQSEAVKEIVHKLTNQVDLCARDNTVSTQTAMTLLRLSFNKKLDYLMRCLSPEVFLSSGAAVLHSLMPAPAGSSFDETVRDAARPLITRGASGMNLSDANPDHVNLAEKFHTSILRFVFERMNVDPAPFLDRSNGVDDNLNPVDLIHLPLSSGGLGLSPVMWRSEFCYLASLANAMRTKTRISIFHELHDFMSAHTSLDYQPPVDGPSTNAALNPGFADELLNKNALFYELQSALDCAVVKGFGQLRECMPTNIDVFFHNFLLGRDSQVATLPMQGLQHKWSEFAKKGHQDLFKNKLNTEAELAHYNCITAPGANKWLTALPASPSTTLSNEDFAVSLLMHLNIHPDCRKDVIGSIFSTDFCPACGSNEALLENPWHFVGCSELKRAFKDRHDQLVEVMRAHLDRLNAVVSKEPVGVYDTNRHTAAERGLRPDIKVTLDDKTVLLDLSVTHPLAKSYVHGASQRKLAAAHEREKVKVKKYVPATEKLHNHSFLPIVFESYGGVAKDAQNFIKMVARYADQNSLTDAPSSIMASLRNALAITLKKGNAGMLREGLNHSAVQISAGRVQVASVPSTPRANTRSPFKRCLSRQSTPVRARSAGRARSLSLAW